MTATAACRRAPLGLALLAAVALVVGCGGGGSTSSAGPEPFDWLRPATAPVGWSVARLPSRAAAVAYPPGWRRLASDPGTVTAALVGRDGLIVGYLNATPRQANESLHNWGFFRPSHNAREGDRAVRVGASATDLPVGGGRGSCVDDTYRTSRTRYREIACLAAGPHAQTVIVAAATAKAWPSLQPTLRAAIRSFRT